MIRFFMVNRTKVGDSWGKCFWIHCQTLEVYERAMDIAYKFYDDALNDGALLYRNIEHVERSSVAPPALWRVPLRFAFERTGPIFANSLEIRSKKTKSIFHFFDFR